MMSVSRVRASRLPWRHRPGREWQWVRHYVPVMVKALFLGLLAATMCGFARAAPAPQPETTPPPQPPLEDPAARSERSTNLSHVTGTARKIQMFIKNRHLQLLPDGTVNGTTDDMSAYSESRSARGCRAAPLHSTPHSGDGHPVRRVQRHRHGTHVIALELVYDTAPNVTRRSPRLLPAGAKISATYADTMDQPICVQVAQVPQTGHCDCDCHSNDTQRSDTRSPDSFQYLQLSQHQTTNQTNTKIFHNHTISKNIYIISIISINKQKNSILGQISKKKNS